MITLEMDNFFLVTVYTPNSQDGLRRLDYRMEWDDAFRDYLKKLDAEKPVVVCGDMNVAHQEIDLKNPKTNHRNAGFTDEEREKFSCLLRDGFTDTFRFFYPEPNRYLFVVVVCASRHAKRTRGGVSTTSWCPTDFSPS